MSSENAIKVEGLSKCFQVYDQPLDRLKQFFFPCLQRMVAKPPRQYYQGFWALKDVSFEVNKGETVGIIGRNGSGKSTLLQIITGTLTPTSGLVETQGRIAALLELGSGFNPEFTGRENVYLNGALLGFSKEQIDEKFDAIAAFADVREYLDQPVKTYSSGMLVRLAFAVQVQVEPEILIVDEALAVGDALFQKRCFQRIEKLVSNGTTVLFVSHDQESVRTLTNRALLLNKGHPVEWGPSSVVVLKYRKLLHDEEISYYSSLTKNMFDQAKQAHIDKVAESQTGNSNELQPADNTLSEKNTCTRSEQLTFGDSEVKVIKVETLNFEGQPCSVYFTGDRLLIRVTCESYTRINKLNIALRLRNKQGIKIYSWGTLNQDMTTHARGLDRTLFWKRHFEVGDTFPVLFECGCDLGQDLYEVQACVSFEETMDYQSQRVLHWVDEAAFFQVVTKRDEYFFGGVTDLKMSATC
ncbi:ABC transporter ATP-binding protein [Endozoicomonas elysicola]|uniref:Sugar ABC transporter ATP-binding protein n=1 Tax=Endozoicomonas elysicola TaxID=305900 RepID=A0A081KAH1_9GAMM|nr:ABC transporter ATP-binding protein [Endozoicomonas elysicola]KEI71147.1 sugar ABC transporter ATP-binding protein [Endozoicomonas elysicola]